MKKGVALLLTAAVTAFVASTAQAAHRSDASASAGISCKSTMKIAFVTPLTGGAGFLGQEQSSWAKYAVKTLAPKLGLKIQLVLGDTPVEQGPAPRRRSHRSTSPTRASSGFSVRRRPARLRRRVRPTSRPDSRTSLRPRRARP